MTGTTVNLGDWVVPWPGEMLMGEVVELAPSGAFDVVCRARNGDVFRCTRADLRAGQVLPAAFAEATLNGHPHGPLSHTFELAVAPDPLTDPQCGSTIAPHARKPRNRGKLKLVE